MNNSVVNYVGDGTTKIFSIPFPYLAPPHLRVLLNGEEVPESDYQITPEHRVVFNSPPSNGSVVTIQRDTPKRRQVTFQNASLLDEGTLNYDGDQLSFIVQEILDMVTATLQWDYDKQWDAQGRRIKNVGEPIEPGDAVNKDYSDRMLVAGEAIAERADRSARQAEEAAESAQESAEAATNERQAAELARDKAEQWADGSSDTEIEPGRYSARHWASVAEELVGYLLVGAEREIPLVSEGGFGYLMSVTSSGILKTTPAEVHDPKNLTFVVDDKFYALTVTDEGQLKIEETLVPVADVIDDLSLYAPNGTIYTITVVIEESGPALKVGPHVGRDSIPMKSFPSGLRYELIVHDDGTVTTIHREVQ